LTSLVGFACCMLASDRMREALTTDHHFEQAGFVKLLAA
jgi:hypothetical protein